MSARATIISRFCSSQSADDWIRLERLRKSITPRPLAKRAVPSVVTVHGCPTGDLGAYLSYVDSSVALIAISLPEFFIGYLLILVFAVRLGWLPSFAMVNSSMSLGEMEPAHAFVTAPAGGDDDG